MTDKNIAEEYDDCVGKKETGGTLLDFMDLTEEELTQERAEKIFDWKEHWGGMPEYNADNLHPVKQLTVNFQTEEDMREFEKLVGQKLTMKTKSIWYPKRETISSNLLRWVDEEDVADADA